jgi:peptidoglycan/LPS O-acetylase OafA/YrhL
MDRRDDIPSLTGLRGIAACSVLFAHAIDISFGLIEGLRGGGSGRGDHRTKADEAIE